MLLVWSPAVKVALLSYLDYCAFEQSSITVLKGADLVLPVGWLEV
jgi:hypothetical protein